MSRDTALLMKFCPIASPDFPLLCFLMSLGGKEATFWLMDLRGDCPGFCCLGVLGRCERGPVDCFIFDGREFAQPSLPSPAMVGSLDPGCDGQSEFLPGEPALPVQDVLLQERKERFHRGVVRA